MLPQEHARTKQELMDMLKGQENVTVTTDAWTSIAKQSVLACNISLPSGETLLLDAKDVSDARHTAEYIAGNSFYRPCNAANSISPFLN